MAQDNLEKFSSSTFFIKKNTAEGIIQALYLLHGKESNSKKQFPVVDSNGNTTKYVDNISFSNINENTANVLDLIKLSAASVQKTSISEPGIVSSGQWYALKGITQAEEVTSQRELGLDIKLEIHPPIITYRTNNSSSLSTYTKPIALETLSTAITLREGKVTPKTVPLSSITFSSPIIKEESSTINLSIKNFTPKVSLEQGWIRADNNYSLLNAYDMTNGWSKENDNFIYTTEINNLTPSNIKKDVNILGVVGALNSVESTSISSDEFRNALKGHNENIIKYSVNYATIAVPSAPINKNAPGMTRNFPLPLYLSGEDLIKRENFDCKTSSVSGELELKIKEEYINELNSNYSVNGGEIYDFSGYAPFSASGWINDTSIPLYFQPYFTSINNSRKSFLISLNQIDEAFVSSNIINEVTMFGVAGTAPNLLSENFKPATNFSYNNLEGNFDFKVYPIKDNYETLKAFSIGMNEIVNAINEMNPEDKNNLLNMIQQ